MHRWARRGLQSALFAGGMLMLGTGIASADDTISPDAPPGPLDGGVSVPIQAKNNVLGTPLGQHRLPEVDSGVISTGQTIGALAAPLGNDVLLGNKVVPEVAVPLQFANNAIGAAGSVETGGEAHQVHQQGGPITTSGQGKPAGGNVVTPQVNLPIQQNNWAFGTLSTAKTNGVATQESTVGGPITTNGDDAAAAGNIVAVQGALPVALPATNHAWGWGGHGEVNDAVSEQTATTPGTLTTSGDHSVASGTTAGAPVAFPVKNPGWAAGWGGTADSNSTHTSVAEAGTTDATTRVVDDTVPYATTSGDGSVVGGTAFTPDLAPQAVVACTSGAWGGSTDVDCVDDTTATTGGGVITSGQESLVGGTAAEAPVALPVAVDGTAAAWGGLADAISTNTAESVSGGEIYTDGTDSLGGGSVLHPQVAGPVEVNCTSGPWGGITSTECANDYTAHAGGGDSTAGDGSVAGGTVADAPVALPATGNHNSAAWGGLSDADGTSVIDSAAGGDIYTGGEGSIVGGTIAHPQVSEPLNPSCNTGAWGGITSTGCEHEVTSVAGGGQETSGDGSIVGGTVADVPATLPGQVCGTAGDWGGISTAECDNTMTSEVGGDTYNHGDDSLGGGNIVGPSLAGDADVICNAGAWGGIPTSTCSNDETVTAGGFQGTSGNNAMAAGNIVDAPLATPVEVLNGAYAWGGIPTSTMTENKVISSGGDNNTDDDGGVVSSNVVSAPEAVGAQVMNIAGAWGGNPTSHGDFVTDVTAGGANSATGESGLGSGNVVTQPSALPVQVNTIGATWGGNAEAIGTNLTDFQSGGPNYANGDNGAVAGNVIEAPIGGAGQVSSWAASWIGSSNVDALNDVTSHAGGPTYTTGMGGLVAGDVIAPQAQPFVQATGQSISFMADTVNQTENTHDLSSGGPISTNGTGGALSGDIISAEPQAMPQVYGLGISAIGSATNDVQNDLVANVGGDETTAGDGLIDGLLVDVPVAADPEVFRWGVGALSTVDNHVDSSMVSQVSGTPTSAMPIQAGVGLVPQVKNVTLGVLAAVTNTGTDTTDIAAGRNPGSVIPVELPLGNIPGGVSPLARDEQSARMGVPAPAGMSNVLYQLSHAPADVIGKATGGVGAAAGRTTGGLLGAAGGAAGQSSRAATPAPALPAVPAWPGIGDLLAHVQQPQVALPGVPYTPQLPVS